MRFAGSCSPLNFSGRGRLPSGRNLAVRRVLEVDLERGPTRNPTPTAQRNAAQREPEATQAGLTAGYATRVPAQLPRSSVPRCRVRVGPRPGPTSRTRRTASSARRQRPRPEVQRDRIRRNASAAGAAPPRARARGRPVHRARYMVRAFYRQVRPGGSRAAKRPEAEAAPSARASGRRCWNGQDRRQPADYESRPGSSAAGPGRQSRSPTSSSRGRHRQGPVAVHRAVAWRLPQPRGPRKKAVKFPLAKYGEGQGVRQG